MAACPPVPSPSPGLYHPAEHPDTESHGEDARFSPNKPAGRPDVTSEVSSLFFLTEWNFFGRKTR